MAGIFYLTKKITLGVVTDYNIRANNTDLWINEINNFEIIMKADQDIEQKLNTTDDGAWPLLANQDWKDSLGNIKNIFITTTVPTNVWIRFKTRT